MRRPWQLVPVLPYRYHFQAASCHTSRRCIVRRDIIYLSAASALHYNLTLFTSYIYQTLRIHGNTAVNSTQIYTKHHTPGDKIQQQNKRRNVSKMLNQMTTARMSQYTISHLLRLASSVLSSLFELYKSPLHQCLTADRNDLLLRRHFVTDFFQPKMLL